MQVQSLGWEDPLEKEMATHSRILAWRIPGTGEPGGLPSMGSSITTLEKALTYTPKNYLSASISVPNFQTHNLFFLFSFVVVFSR